MKCPYFQTECLKEGCTAFEWEEYSRLYGFTVYSIRSGEMGEEYIGIRPYCHALKTELPGRK